MTAPPTTGAATPAPEADTRVLSRVNAEDVYSAVADEALLLVQAALEFAAAEARLRVTTLPRAVMAQLCERLQDDARWVARLLCNGAPEGPWEATATKLIELRNTLREPLLVCIPPGLRTAAEDSLDIATFGELALPDLVTRVWVRLLTKLDKELAVRVLDAVVFLKEQRVIRGDDVVVEYLRTVLANGGDAAAAGGSLFVFGLLPDFALYTRGGERVWLDRNIKASEILADASQPLQTRIARLKAEPNTIQTPLFAFLRTRRVDSVREWAGDIATDPGRRNLSFDNWSFTDAQNATELRIILEPLALPRQTADEVGGAVQLPVLDLEKAAGLKVGFKASPAPAQLPAWKHFRVQILSVSGADGQPSVAWESNSYPKPTGRQATVRRTIKKADLDGLEEGTYFLRVEAYDESGAVLLQPRRIDPTDERSRFEHESDVFLVTRGESSEPEPEPTRAIFTASLSEAWLLAASRGIGQKKRGDDADPPDRSQIHGSWQEPVGAAPKGDVHFQLEGPGMDGYAVVLPAILRRLELEFLAQPHGLAGLQVDLSAARTVSDATLTRRADRGLAAALADLAEGTALLEARAALFAAVSSQHLDRAGKSGDEEAKLRRGLVETADLAAIASAVYAYADAYVHLVEVLADRGATPEATDARQESIAWLRQLALLDTVEVRWRRAAGDPGRALLLSPTHPVRIAWHLQHALVSAELLEGWRDGALVGRDWRSVLDHLRQDVLPLNLPMVMFDPRGRAYVEHVPLTAHWSLYLPDRGPVDAPLDAAACRDTLRQLLGIRGRTTAVEPVGAEDLAALMFDYVQQHPYVEQLRLNVFNPGDGELVAEALRSLERRRKGLATRNADAPQIRYAVQLFGTGERLESLGRAFESLLDPDRQVEEDDEFTLTSTNHLLPKLVFARNAVSEFVRTPEAFPAHLSIFYEQFGVQGRLGSVAELRRGTFVRGLVHEPETTPEDTPGRFGWFRGLRPSGAPAASGLERALDALLDAAQRVQAISAAGEVTAPGVAPVVAVQLDQQAQALLRQAHDVSDWVLTIDRNIGLEYFDSPSSVQECGYLLDFSPEFLQSDRQRLLLTTRSALELDALVRPALQHLGLGVQAGDELPVLDALRSMSGRLALRLLASGTRVSEIGGLLLARWLLEAVGVLEDRVVIPVDAHRGWFDAQEDGPTGGPTSRRRADLLVVGFNPARRVIDVVVIEVKWRESLGQSDRGTLYRSMREQAENTEKRLRERFDLDLYGTPRADAVLQAKELATLLAFYARRAHRYGMLSAGTLSDALDFVQSLDGGYRLDVRSLGVVFERQGIGAHVDEEEIGFPVHRIGLDVANELLARAREQFVASRTQISEAGNAPSDVDEISVPTPERIAEERRSRPPLRHEAMLDSFRSAVSGGIQRGTHRAGNAVREPKPASGRSSTENPASPTAQGNTPDAGRNDASGDDGSMRAAPAERPQSASVSEQQAPPHPSAPEFISRPQPAGETGRASGTPIAGEVAEIPIAQRVLEQPSAGDGWAAQEEARADGAVAPRIDVLVGANEMTPQYGVLGRAGSGAVAIDLTGCNTISLFGVQGFGKSYTLGVVSEMATTPATGVNVLPAPLATVIFHYHKSDSYAPEMAAAVAANSKAREVEQLLADYAARPTGLRDVVLLSPEARVEDRRAEFPRLEVQPIKFASGELGAEGWKFLLGATGSDALYVRQLVAIMRKYRRGLTLNDFRREIETADLSPNVRRLAEDRLNLAAPYVDDAARLADLLRPGRTVIVDLRDEWVEKDEALGLFVVMLRIFATAKYQGRSFNKLVVFDEAHKYITDSELVGQVVETIREMRHQATNVVIASQDPLSVPRAVIELTSILLLHRMTSPQWLKHLKSAIGALDQLTDSQVAALQPGEALVWAQRSTDKRFTQRPQRIKVRPRFSQHGGGTKTAVSGATVR